MSGRAGRRLACWLVLGTALLAPLAAPAPRAATPPPAWRGTHQPPPSPGHRGPKSGLDPATLAADARREEDSHAYARALLRLRELRGRVRPDADLELAMALDEARSGQADSAWIRLHGPLLTRALADTTGTERRTTYSADHAGQWLDGHFGGWYWYVARARAELALLCGRPADGLADARRAAEANPCSAADHLLLGLIAARAGQDGPARLACRRAVALSPALPEAQYLLGLLAWRDGDRGAAREAFEAAIGRDSSFREPALALVRLRLPGTRPDSLPGFFLTGPRRIGVLTLPDGPKLEENPYNDQLPAIYGQPVLTLSDSLQAIMALQKPIHLYVTALVDPAGRTQLTDLPWLPEGRFPVGFVGAVNSAAAQWSFRPAVKVGHPAPAWASVELIINP